MIHVQAFAIAGHQLQAFSITVSMDIERHTRLNTGQHANQPLLNTLFFCDPASYFFFVRPT